MTAIPVATLALQEALDAGDLETIKALRAEYDRLLFTYNPNQATPEQRAFERAMQEADAVVYPRARCKDFAHLDDCMTRCGKRR